MARNVKDRPIAAGLPRSFRGQDQLDGTHTTLMTPPPAKFSQGGSRPLQTREAAPARAGSGVESTMDALADREHPTR